MKQLFLFMLAACFAVFTYAQQAQQFKVGVKQEFARNHSEEGMVQSTNPYKIPTPDINSGVSAKDVTIRTIGDAGNAWGLSSGNRTFLWADNDLQSIVFPHRMLNPPGTGFLAYDVSTDQGATWEINQQVYDPNLYPAGAALGNARYPQAGIYNPAGNTDPANAYMTYFAPVLDQTNGGSWGGYGRGTNPLTAVNPTTPTQEGFTSPGGDLLFSVPDAFHITSDGQAICLEPSLVDGLFANYTGYLIYNYGYYNETTNLFEYSQELIDFDISAGGTGHTVSASKIAFHPDGQTGYIATITNNGENELAEGCYYPVLFKTTDGGESWDGPFPVQLGGEDGLPAVLNYLTDAFLEYIYEPPIPAREELLFTTGFEIDLAVDINGDPHILFTVGLRGTDAFSIATGWEGLFGTGNSIALIHAASYGGDMETWYADTLHTPITFRGTFAGDLSDDLRENISITPSGQELFFSWQCTDIENIEDNLAPDIYCIGYQLGVGYTELYNVSAFTEIMWQSWMASGSYYVFDDGAGSYEVPFVCQIINPDDDLQPVQFKYVDNFIITDADFGVWVGTAEPRADDIITISGNYPNPCRNTTNINMTLTEYANVQLEISNLIGQTVKTVNYGAFNTGTHRLSIDVADLESGIYIYTVTAGNDAVAGKMVVE